MPLDDELGKFNDERTAFLNRLVKRERDVYCIPNFQGGYYRTTFTTEEKNWIELAELKDRGIVGAISDCYTHITETPQNPEVIEQDLERIKETTANLHQRDRNTSLLLRAWKQVLMRKKKE